MPRIHKKLPPNRADWSFGDLVYWHLFEFGTRPNINPSALAGRKWKPDAICELLGITQRTLRNWIADRHFPDSLVDLERELFGDNPAWELARLELAEALGKTRARKTEEAARARPGKSAPVPHRRKGAATSTQGEPAEESGTGETGKVRKSAPDGSEKSEKSEESPPDVRETSGDVSRPEDAAKGKTRKAAPDSSAESGSSPAEESRTEPDRAGKGPEPEPAASGTQPGREEAEQDETEARGAVPDLRPPSYRNSAQPRRLAISIVTGATVVLGLYAVMLNPGIESRKPAQPSASGPPAEPRRGPGPQARLPPSPQGGAPVPQTPERQDAPPSTPQVAPAPQTPGRQEKAQPGPEAAPPAPPKPAGQAQPKPVKPALRPRTEEERRAEEERRILQKTIEAMKAAHDREMREREEEARRLDREGAAGAAARARREREWNARQVAGTGYELLEYTSVNGTPIGKAQTETVYDCALSCIEPRCDAFAWFRDERPAGPRTCNRYKAPVTFYDHSGFTAGRKRSGLPSGFKLTAAESPAQSATLRPVARAAPAAPADADGVTHCPTGPVKVTGFDLSCDTMLVGGTTLGSNRLSWTVKNINECARKCQPIRNCVGFTYNAAQRGGHSCVLFGPTPQKRDAKGWISGERPVQ